MVNLDDISRFGAHRARWWQRAVWWLCDFSWLPREWRRKLRKRYARRIVGPFDITHRGLNFRTYPAENYCDRVLFGRNQLPERAEHEALAALIEPGLVFVDIGANVGSYSVFVGQHAGGDATLVALEPHPRTFRKLVFNLQANGLSTEHAVNCAAGPSATQMDLWSDGGSNIGHTSMLKEGTANPKVSVKVPVLPLIGLLTERNISRIDLLKIDIEGFEDRALAPFLDTAPDSLIPGHILLETAHRNLWERNLLDMFEARGYRTVFSTAENQLLSRSS